ncbi:MAG: UDP-N-acetylglucosamine pyrophosphorylase, partial [Kiritimatiellia bacterium]|nr:UDP-N-acetylglucosamine pyrophosphorylase [Kiritimatiellia bacterium]
MSKPLTGNVEPFLKRGVLIAEPALVTIDQTVALEHIAPGTMIHPFCRISGSKTSIGPDCVLGAEAPVTIDNCQLSAQVKLVGGYFSGATFLDNSGMGSGAQVRPGTLVEEEAGGAHTVGLKQTVLFPYVVLGSLINFCDCLMAG